LQPGEADGTVDGMRDKAGGHRKKGQGTNWSRQEVEGWSGRWGSSAWGSALDLVM